MNTWNSRITQARIKTGMNKSAFARAVGVSTATTTDWESGKIKKLEGENLLKVSKVLGVTPDWLLTGKEPTEPRRTTSLPALPSGGPAGRAEPSATILGPIEPWDSSTPLDEDEVEIPLYTETQLAAGNGSTITRENHGPKLRFSKSTLRRQGVNIPESVCVGVTGNSMEPVLPDGCTVGIDTSQTTIRDGKMYAIRQGDLVRVKMAYRLPMGGLRLRSYNRDEYADEDYTPEQMADLCVIGRVFWSSVLW